MSIKKIFVTSLLTLPVSGFATESNENNVKFGLHAGIGGGGDTLAEFEFSDGSNEKITAGSGVILGMSLQKTLTTGTDNVINGKFAFSYMFDSVDAENGDAKFSRFPIDFLLLGRTKSISYGGGLTYHLNPTLSVDAPGLKGDVDFDNALGAKLEANYHFSGSTKTDSSLGLEYTSIDYKISGFSVSGSGVNLVFKSTF